MIDIIIIILGICLFIGLIIYFVYQIKAKKKNPFNDCGCNCTKNDILKQYHKKYKKTR